MNRRHFLAHTSVATLGLGAWGSLLPQNSMAAAFSAENNADTNAEARLVVMVLRGGLDGLFAAPAVGDPQFASARGALAQYEQAPLPLDGLFALHPAWPHLHSLYQNKQLIVAHALGLPYQQRSHFDAQNVLDTGSSRPFESKDGWLNRATGLWARQRGNQPQAVALSSTIPLMLQGAASVTNWSGAQLGDVSGDTLDRLTRLYANDPLLATALGRARGAAEMSSDMLEKAPGGAALRKPRPGANANSIVGAASQAAKFLAAPKGSRLAVIEAGGWDSHINQALPQGQFMRNLAALDQAIQSLQAGLGAVWQRTAVLVVTEFGRTVHTNGTGGSDHGVGMMALLAGGAVRGGRTLSDWPGLASGQLLDGRDLRPTSDVRALFKGVLTEHLQLNPQAVESQVFPGSAAAKAVTGLFDLS